jgi:tRNA U34 5-carboxymethylaminomethyl modifying enzyme MnmG/GidA
MSLFQDTYDVIVVGAVVHAGCEMLLPQYGKFYASRNNEFANYSQMGCNPELQGTADRERLMLPWRI